MPTHPSPYLLFWWAGFLIFLTTATPAVAQGPLSTQGPLPERRGSAPATQPWPQLPPPPAPPAPPVPKPAREMQPAPASPSFVLKGVRLTGNTVLEPASIDQVVTPFLGHAVGMRDIEDIRQRLTLLYVNRGYINSGVVIPDQTLTNGILELHAVEGRLTNIDLIGNRYYRTSYLTDRLNRGVTVPFNVNDLARQQQILLEDPFLSRLNLDIQPGLMPGEARVNGEVIEAQPWSLSVQIADDQSPTVGAVRGQLQGTIANLLGVGDVLGLQYGRSGGLNDGYVAYSVPVSSDDTRLSVRYDINGSLVVDQGLQPLNITSRYQSVGLGLSRPFYQTPEQNLTLGLSLEWRQSQTFLLGEPFSFVAGAQDGKTNVTVLRLYQSWLDRNATRVIALRSTFSFGLDALGATTTSVKPNARFFAWLGQAQYVRRIFNDWELLTRANLQLSLDPLFPIEQFVLGGFYTVRGYREYLTSADNAFTGTIELRIPVGKVQLPWVGANEEAGTVQIVPFFDHGAGWNTRQPGPQYPNLTSIGVGLRWFIRPGTIAELYYGYGLRHVHAGNSIEDRGIFFRVASMVF
ncbi:MAG: ShlB/FhaC/HecB family hemolysin secretion/activation protein [Acetobacteraceae bacterium]